MLRRISLVGSLAMTQIYLKLRRNAWRNIGGA